MQRVWMVFGSGGGSVVRRLGLDEKVRGPPIGLIGICYGNSDFLLGEKRVLFLVIAVVWDEGGLIWGLLALPLLNGELKSM